jgi:hypothetical protein
VRVNHGFFRDRILPPTISVAASPALIYWI